MNAILLRPDIIKAIQEASQGYGIERLAAEMDMRPSSLYNCLNPWGDRSVSKLGLEAALHIMKATKDKTALAMIARELGCMLIPLSKSDKDTVEDEIVDAFTAIAKLTDAIRNRADLAEVTRWSNLAHHEVEQIVDRYRKSAVEFP
jgi:hypothetical protein